MTRFQLRCRHCDMLISSTDLIRDGEIEKTEVHLREHHPRVSASNVSGRLAHVLRNTLVKNESAGER